MNSLIYKFAQDDLMSTMNMMKAKLEKEQAAHAETRQQLTDLIRSVDDIRSQVNKIHMTDKSERIKYLYLCWSQ